jgi:hypothetical protein
MLYLISDKGVLVYTAIDKRDDYGPVMDDFTEFGPSGPPGKTDLNKDGVLLVDLRSRQQVKAADGSDNLVYKYQIRKYSGQ